MPKLIIDDREIEVPKGTKVIDAAEKLGLRFLVFATIRPWGRWGLAACARSSSWRAGSRESR